jgi:hypothetical protein
MHVIATCRQAQVMSDQGWMNRTCISSSSEQETEYLRYNAITIKCIVRGTREYDDGLPNAGYLMQILQSFHKSFLVND